MHAFSTCSVRFPSVLLHDLDIYLFASFCQFQFSKSTPFGPSIPFPFPCRAIFQPDQSAASSRFSRFFPLFLCFFGPAAFWPFRLLFEFRFLLVFPALQSGNCISPLSIRLALGHLAINFGKLNKKLIFNKLKYFTLKRKGFTY